MQKEVAKLSNLFLQLNKIFLHPLMYQFLKRNVGIIIVIKVK